MRPEALLLPAFLSAGLLTPACGASPQHFSEPPVPIATDCVGDVNLITHAYETSETGEGSNSSSRGRNVVQETVLDMTDSGMLLHVTFPDHVPESEASMQWQFPAIIRRTSDGTLTLVNREELESRLETWLDLAELGREACGEWIFTWNAFEIVCDPDSAIEMYRMFDMRRYDLQDGASFESDLAGAPGQLQRDDDGSGYPALFRTELALDPEVIREQLAEQDVIVAGFVGDAPLTLEDAIAVRAGDDIAGTLTVSLKVDQDGRLVQQTVRQDMSLTTASGETSRRESENAAVRVLIDSDRTDAGLCKARN